MRALALQNLSGKLDDSGRYQEVHQQDATLQMSAMAGVPQYGLREMHKQQIVCEAKVSQTPESNSLHESAWSFMPFRGTAST